jgi:hypothetical protein
MKIDLLSGLILAIAGASVLLMIFGKFFEWFIDLDFHSKRKRKHG